MVSMTSKRRIVAFCSVFCCHIDLTKFLFNQDKLWWQGGSTLMGMLSFMTHNWQKDAFLFHPIRINIIWGAYSVPLSVVYKFSSLTEASIHNVLVFWLNQGSGTLGFQFTVSLRPLWWGGQHYTLKVDFVRTWKQDEWVQGYPMG